MIVRPATLDDVPAVVDLLRALEGEVPPPVYVDGDEDRRTTFIEEYVSDHVALLAEGNGLAQGFLLARMRRPRLAYVEDVYVRPSARRSGVAASLFREALRSLRERGAEFVALEVFSENEDARAVYDRWGFREARLWLEVATEDLERRVAGESSTPSG